MLLLRGILGRLRSRRLRRRAPRTFTGSAAIELYHDKTPITGRVDLTLTEIRLEET